MGFERDVPRCETCKAYRRARTRLVEETPVKMPARCAVGGFEIRPVDCCDHWVGRDGTTLA
jgi:hypothetical protein